MIILKLAMEVIQSIHMVAMILFIPMQTLTIMIMILKQKPLQTQCMQEMGKTISMVLMEWI